MAQSCAVLCEQCHTTTSLGAMVPAASEDACSQIQPPCPGNRAGPGVSELKKTRPFRFLLLKGVVLDWFMVSSCLFRGRSPAKTWQSMRGTVRKQKSKVPFRTRSSYRNRVGSRGGHSNGKIRAHILGIWEF